MTKTSIARKSLVLTLMILLVLFSSPAALALDAGYQASFSTGDRATDSGGNKDDEAGGSYGNGGSDASDEDYDNGGPDASDDDYDNGGPDTSDDDYDNGGPDTSEDDYDNGGNDANNYDSGNDGESDDGNYDSGNDEESDDGNYNDSEDGDSTDNDLDKRDWADYDDPWGNGGDATDGEPNDNATSISEPDRQQLETTITDGISRYVSESVSSGGIIVDNNNALMIDNTIASANTAVNRSLERLSTGFRARMGSDDVSELNSALAEGMANGLRQGMAEGLAEARNQGMREAAAIGLIEQIAEELVVGLDDNMAEGIADGIREAGVRDNVVDELAETISDQATSRMMDVIHDFNSSNEPIVQATAANVSHNIGDGLLDGVKKALAVKGVQGLPEDIAKSIAASMGIVMTNTVTNEFNARETANHSTERSEMAALMVQNEIHNMSQHVSQHMPMSQHMADDMDMNMSMHVLERMTSRQAPPSLEQLNLTAIEIALENPTETTRIIGEIMPDAIQQGVNEAIAQGIPADVAQEMAEDIAEGISGGVNRTPDQHQDHVVDYVNPLETTEVLAAQEIAAYGMVRGLYDGMSEAYNIYSAEGLSEESSLDIINSMGLVMFNALTTEFHAQERANHSIHRMLDIDELAEAYPFEYGPRLLMNRLSPAERHRMTQTSIEMALENETETTRIINEVMPAVIQQGVNQAIAQGVPADVAQRMAQGIADGIPKGIAEAKAERTTEQGTARVNSVPDQNSSPSIEPRDIYYGDETIAQTAAANIAQDIEDGLSNGIKKALEVAKIQGLPNDTANSMAEGMGIAMITSVATEFDAQERTNHSESYINVIEFREMGMTSANGTTSRPIMRSHIVNLAVMEMTMESQTETIRIINEVMPTAITQGENEPVAQGVSADVIQEMAEDIAEGIADGVKEGISLGIIDLSPEEIAEIVGTTPDQNSSPPADSSPNQDAGSSNPGGDNSSDDVIPEDGSSDNVNSEPVIVSIDAARTQPISVTLTAGIKGAVAASTTSLTLDNPVMNNCRTEFHAQVKELSANIQNQLITMSSAAGVNNAALVNKLSSSSCSRVDVGNAQLMNSQVAWAQLNFTELVNSISSSTSNGMEQGFQATTQLGIPGSIAKQVVQLTALGMATKLADGLPQTISNGLTEAGAPQQLADEIAKVISDDAVNGMFNAMNDFAQKHQN